jgi:diguanylate cyclase (GGDEF)-like protein/PAS domain S-box-containing protein
VFTLDSTAIKTNEAQSLSSRLVSLCEGLRGWRLWFLFSLATVFAAELIVSAMGLLLKGEVTHDYLLTGLVTASCVAPVSLALLTRLLEDYRRVKERALASEGLQTLKNLQLSLDAARMVFWELDLKHKTLSFDDSRIHWLGLTPSPDLHSLDGLLKRVHMDDRATLLASIGARTTSSADEVGQEYRFLQADGNWAWYRTVGRVAQRDEAGNVVLVAGGTVDISRRKQAEADGIAARQKLHDTLEALPDLLFEVDHQGRFLDCHAPPSHLLVQTPEGFLGKNLVDVLPPEVAEVCLQALAVAQRQGFSNGAQYCLNLPEGLRWFELSIRGRVMAEPASRFIVLARDITDRKKAELALATSRQLLQSIIDTVPLSVFWKDQQLQYLGCNPAFARDAGFADTRDIIGKTDAQLAWSDRSNLYSADDNEVMCSGESKLSYEEQQSDPTGGYRWLRTSKVPLRGKDNEVIGVLGIYEDVTAFKQAEHAVRASEEHASRLATMLRLISDNVPDMIWAKDLDKRYLFANKAMCEQLFNATNTDEPVGRNDLFFARREREGHPGDSLWHTFGECCQDTDEQTLLNGKTSQFEESGYVKGKYLCLDVHKAPLLDEHGQVIGVVGSARDITAQKSAQEKLLLASLVLENSSEAMVATDADNRIVDVNPAFTTVTGYTRDEVLGKNPSVLRSGRQGPDFYRDMWRDLQTQGHWRGELWNKRKSGEIYAELLTVNTIYDDDGSVKRRVALFSDVTEKKHAEELIWKQANFDALTGLPNRRMFHDRLAQELIKAHRSGLKVAVFFLDLDHFKEVNDTLGHETGDRLLEESARRIAGCVRASDTVARLGGDEFTVILPELDEPTRVEVIASNIIQSLSQVFDLDGHFAHVTASIGITLYPDDATNADVLMQNADQAMYEAKRAGRGRFSYFTRAMQTRALAHQYLMDELRAAMKNGQLKLFYQPIVSLSTGRLHKVEALLRWFHPQRGMVSPAEFIPLAEECGLIHEVGDWVFSQAVHQAQRWSSLMGKNFKIALNMSPLQLLQSNVHHIRWREQLASSGLSGQNFVIEISEGMLHHSSMAVVTQLQAFRDAGTEVSVDHFGADCTSFMALKRRQIEYFKIEKTTIQSLTSGADGLATAQAVVVMAHQLGLKVIAEGVETLKQHELLSAMGCDFAQGFLYSKPVAASEVESLFAQDSQLSLPI